MNFRKRENQQQQSFQMAPMVDVIFLLLVFFMAASVYSQLEGKMDVIIPSAEHGKSVENEVESIKVNINKDGVCSLNNLEVSFEELSDYLEEKKQDNKELIISARIDKRSEFVHFAKLNDLCSKLDIKIFSYDIEKQ